ncbi:unnamed protein product [Didymodactylos carnosus]|uniref:Cadherin domain-containing protein n=1 Tax=Didymodactylos carnosus TaxID=1234261 RepID=A0A813PID9_9BILA|nr:unnamed protein product [Didymodactylos carnosus]CAF0753882.1 unnamed protein product [Didymodactylos carnosus]CAF3527396.1 unnamed protein product [Didymodactylos carnosus]CAF3533933.1 unnamed protein product [Didymodactylos carnosus]
MDTRSRTSGPLTEATEYIKQGGGRGGGRYALATAVLDSIVLIFIIVIAFLLRASDIFPVRQQRFLCDDARYYQSYEDGSIERNYILLSNIALYSLCLLIPILVITIIELIRSFLYYNSYKTRYSIKLKNCLLLAFARILKYISVFIFGALSTTIITDILKIMSGRLRPYFLTLCNPDQKSCNGMGLTDADFVCLSKNMTNLMREARQVDKFAIFLAIYLHRGVNMKRVRIVKPFLILSLITLSIVCGAVRLASNHNHWEDIFVGFVLGSIIAIYLVKTIYQSIKPGIGTPVRTYDDYQSYVDDQIQYTKEIDANYAAGLDAVYQTTTPHSLTVPEQFSLQPSASQGHIAGFSRHRYDLKQQQQLQQQQQQQQLHQQALANQQYEKNGGVVQQLVHQIQQQPQQSISQREKNSPIGTHVVDLTSDQNKIMLLNMSGFELNYFTLNKTDNSIRITKLIDREQFVNDHYCDRQQCLVELHLLVQDGLKYWVIPLHIVDVNDCKPKFARNELHLVFRENVPIGYKIPFQGAIDYDEGVNGQIRYILDCSNTVENRQWNHYQYKIPSSIDCKMFELTILTQTSITYDQLALKFIGNSTDKEPQSEYILTLYAVDNGQEEQLQNSMKLFIKIDHMSDRAPIFTQKYYEFLYISMIENQTVPLQGTIFGRVLAHNNDEEINRIIRYSIVGSSYGIRIGLFTGELIASSNIIISKYNDIQLTIEVSNNEQSLSSKFESQTRVKINFRDQSKLKPDIDMKILSSDREMIQMNNLSSITFLVHEQVFIGQPLLELIIRNRFYPNDTFTLSLDSHMKTFRFISTPQTNQYILKTRQLLTKKIYFLTSSIKHTLSQQLLTNIDIKLIVTNDNDWSPKFKSDSYSITVQSHLPRVQATNAYPLAIPITYAIEQNPYITINQLSGSLSFLSAPSTSQQLSIYALGPRSNSSTLLNIDYILPSTPFCSKNRTFTIRENAPVGTIIGTLEVIDDNMNKNYSISQINLFIIDLINLKDDALLSPITHKIRQNQFILNVFIDIGDKLNMTCMMKLNITNNIDNNLPHLLRHLSDENDIQNESSNFSTITSITNNKSDFFIHTDRQSSNMSKYRIKLKLCDQNNALLCSNVSVLVIVSNIESNFSIGQYEMSTGYKRRSWLPVRRIELALFALSFLFITGALVLALIICRLKVCLATKNYLLYGKKYGLSDVHVNKNDNSGHTQDISVREEHPHDKRSIHETADEYVHYNQTRDIDRDCILETMSNIVHEQRQCSQYLDSQYPWEEILSRKNILYNIDMFNKQWNHPTTNNNIYHVSSPRSSETSSDQFLNRNSSFLKETKELLTNKSMLLPNIVHCIINDPTDTPQLASEV